MDTQDKIPDVPNQQSLPRRFRLLIWLGKKWWAVLVWMYPEINQHGR